MADDRPAAGALCRRWIEKHPDAAEPYRLLGSTAVAIDVGALVVNGTSIALIAWLARRRGGTALMLTLLVGIGLFVHGAGVEFMRSPWNPVLTVLPYALMVLMTWSAPSSCRARSS